MTHPTKDLLNVIERILASAEPSVAKANHVTVHRHLIGELREAAQVAAPHASDCATNNAPALPVGPCDCWPDPTPEMLQDPRFEAIWQVVKSWDINVPHAYHGYCGATGNHVRAILDALDRTTVETGARQPFYKLLDAYFDSLTRGYSQTRIDQTRLAIIAEYERVAGPGSTVETKPVPTPCDDCKADRDRMRKALLCISTSSSLDEIAALTFEGLNGPPPSLMKTTCICPGGMLGRNDLCPADHSREKASCEHVWNGPDAILGGDVCRKCGAVRLPENGKPEHG